MTTPAQPARWPFPLGGPPAKDKPDGKKPKFNPSNHEEAPL